jgi:hypothetical protein
MEGVINMSTIKKIITDMIVTLVMGIVSVIGMLAGFVIFNSGLGEKIEEKTRQLFNKEK